MRPSLQIAYTVTAIAGILCTGCSSDECLQNKNALPLAGFYDTQEPTRKVSIDSLEVYGKGAPGDSILFSGKSAINELYLPFRLDHDTTTYVFRYLHTELAEAQITDTVSFIYSRTPRFVSSACGVSYIFGIEKIENSNFLIDSVSCPAGEITNMATENLHIYFRVKKEDASE